MTRPAATDAQLDAILGHVHGVRGATFEEGAAMQADYLRDRAQGAPDGRRIALDAAILRHTARLLDALALLSREATP